MLVRVDDFPCGNEDGQREFDALDALLRFHEVLDAPFCLGVVLGGERSGYTTREEWDTIRQLPGVHPASHGFEHRLLTHETVGMLRELRVFFGPGAVMIPPRNVVTQPVVDKLASVGFGAVCTGEDRAVRHPNIRFKDIVEVPSAFYGTAELFLAEEPRLGKYDCLTLHLTWERRGGKGYPGDKDFGALAALAAQCRDRIRPWGEFIEGRE